MDDLIGNLKRQQKSEKFTFMIILNVDPFIRI